MPTPLVPAQKPIARCRSAGSLNMFVMIDSVDGMISAPPMPMLARAAISMLTEPENAAQAEPAANAARPARSTSMAMVQATNLRKRNHLAT